MYPKQMYSRGAGKESTAEANCFSSDEGAAPPKATWEEAVAHRTMFPKEHNVMTIAGIQLRHDS
jgi:hypothetical protein